MSELTDPPSGQVTFLMTDVEGSTLLWDRDPDLMRDALAEHDRRLRAAVERHDGYVFTTAGDSFAVSFVSPTDALAAATEAQLSLLEPAGDIVLKVRMGLHAGHATVRDGDYFGIDVNRCARLMSAGYGGQILMSQSTAEVLRDSLPSEQDLIDLGEHRLKDLAQPERIFQLRHPQLDDRVRRLRAIEGPAPTLPLQLTSFVGREREAAEISELLAAERMVTLVGAGGAGKTRLAIHVVEDVLAQFPDGIRLVELAAVTNADVLIDEVAQAVGSQTSPDVEVAEAIANSIGDGRFLLVLDNCEHLVASVASLCRLLLGACPQLRILATSRELLRVAGESVYRVPSLVQPPAAADALAAAEYDSVRLFDDRARLGNSDFKLDEQNVRDIIDICRRLDGIPLAIELAAARLRVMSPTQIAARLDGRFRVLGDTQDAIGTRHQTLRATIDWSHDLLAEPERVLFRRLSWFTGDFSLEAAEYVGSGGVVDAHDVIEVLSSLVDKSMVAPERDADGATRYRLLETMREYGHLRLSGSDDAVATPLKHVEFYAGLCEALQQQERAGQLGEALALRDQEEDNVRAALRWAIDEGRFESAARIVGAIGYLWYAGGLFREGIEWCKELFASEPELPDEMNAAALHAYGTLLGSWEQPAVGVGLIEREVDLRRQLGDPVRLASALNNLGNLLADIGRFDDSETALREAIELFRAAGKTPSISFSSLGYSYLHRGEFDTATALYTEALDEAVAFDDVYGIALATSYLGVCAARCGRPDEGQDLLERAWSSFEELSVPPGVAEADFQLAMIDRDEGRVDAAAQRLLAALTAPEAHWQHATQYWIMQVTASMIPDLGQAAELLGVAAGFYERSTESQSTYLMADFERIRSMLQHELGADDFDARFNAGKSLRLTDSIVVASGALTDLTAGQVDEQPEGLFDPHGQFEALLEQRPRKETDL